MQAFTNTHPLAHLLPYDYLKHLTTASKVITRWGPSTLAQDCESKNPFLRIYTIWGAILLAMEKRIKQVVYKERKVVYVLGLFLQAELTKY